jgi:hypothetical protein
MKISVYLYSLVLILFLSGCFSFPKEYNRITTVDPISEVRDSLIVFEEYLLRLPQKKNGGRSFFINSQGTIVLNEHYIGRWQTISKQLIFDWPNNLVEPFNKTEIERLVLLLTFLDRNNIEGGYSHNSKNTFIFPYMHNKYFRNITQANDERIILLSENLNQYILFGNDILDEQDGLLLLAPKNLHK